MIQEQAIPIKIDLSPHVLTLRVVDFRHASEEMGSLIYQEDYSGLLATELRFVGDGPPDAPLVLYVQHDPQDLPPILAFPGEGITAVSIAKRTLLIDHVERQLFADVSLESQALVIERCHDDVVIVGYQELIIVDRKGTEILRQAIPGGLRKLGIQNKELTIEFSHEESRTWSIP